ncbi:similar to Saccharomyces cerevisiae YML087C AIM33 Putative protein of unknown function, highly conserved across species and orthologous to human CYB5R4 [Maudiozyma saulgeensis]|uniref:FAD-binding FR-type domain-containing protein n=1 Tax=Maudiozyma saulgeensis TaxID=1789683 RepID=A0A1X7R8L9_9SACH|nr:similar to Saccharomyces cerevisiae YML087C AIM33 Putative protein of unknown function, highly conserved across species and orthologous to human CYB5R4 [Kazachstania saulgeensis]
MTSWPGYIEDQLMSISNLGLTLRLILVLTCVSGAYLARLRFSLMVITILFSIAYILAYFNKIIKCKKMISAVKRKMHGSKWTQFQITCIKKISKDTSIYTFNIQYPEGSLHLPLGHHVQVRAMIHGRQTIRYYTPIFPSETTKELQLMVKSYSNGTMSKYLSTLHVGQTVEIRGPFGNPTSDNNQHYPLQKEIETYRKMGKESNSNEETLTQLGIVAGGSGITPVLQVLHEIVTNPYHLENISLIYANETVDDILLKNELDEMAKKHPHFQIHYVLHHPPKGWKGERGYITKRMLQKYLPRYNKQHKLLVCGPLEMDELVLRYSKELGWNKGFQKSRSNDKVFVF